MAVAMFNFLLAHAALGGALGLGSRVTVLFLPSLAGLIEGALISGVFGYQFAVGCILAISIMTCVHVGYIIGSMVMAFEPENPVA